MLHQHFTERSTKQINSYKIKSVLIDFKLKTLKTVKSLSITEFEVIVQILQIQYNQDKLKSK